MYLLYARIARVFLRLHIFIYTPWWYFIFSKHMHTQTWVEAKLGLHEKAVNLVWKGFSFNTQWIHLTRYTYSFILFIFLVMFTGHKLGQNTHTHTRAANSFNNRKTKGQKVNGYCTVSFGSCTKSHCPSDRMPITWQSWAVLSTGPQLSPSNLD